MTKEKTDFPRGSEWRIWDFHVHTPASFHWNGDRFERDSQSLDVLDSEKNNTILDKMIETMNKSQVAVFVLMDYWTFDGWFALKKRLKSENAPQLTKKVFPGIELRLDAPTRIRLNAHAVFSDSSSDQALLDFLGKLNVSRIKRPLSKESIIEYANKAGDDKLKKHNIFRSVIDGKGEDALISASKIVDITAESYKTAMESCGAIGFMPFDTSDGLSEVNWHEHYSYFINLFSSSPIFESRKQETRDMLLLIENEKNQAFMSNVRKSLMNIPRLVVSGSDAHRFFGVDGNNDKRGYGQFPSGKATWIKADPTYEGLLQAIKEPAKRSFIGEEPPKIAATRHRQQHFIDSLQITFCDEKGKNKWFDECNLELNYDLVAIIGNKGSGKSALADIIALAASSVQKDNFSFLNKSRFFASDYKDSFEISLKLRNEQEYRKNLNKPVLEEEYERVQYIPQGYFEKICASHDRKDLFELELNKVIFSYIPSEERNGVKSFDDFNQNYENSFQRKLDSLRVDLKELNRKIVFLEEQLDPVHKNRLVNQRNELTKELKSCEDSRPPEPTKPSTVDPQIKELQVEMERLTNLKIELSEALPEKERELQTLKECATKIKTLEGRINNEKLELEKRLNELSPLLSDVGVNLEDVINVSFSLLPLNNAKEINSNELNVTKGEVEEKNKNLQDVMSNIDKFREKLDEPSVKYQKAQELLHEWKARMQKINGSEGDLSSLLGVTKKINEIENEFPAKLKDLQTKRENVSLEIFSVILDKKRQREHIFEPAQKSIDENELIGKDIRLEFRSPIIFDDNILVNSLFSLVKKISGKLRGDTESEDAIRKLLPNKDDVTSNDILKLIQGLHDILLDAESSAGYRGKGLRTILKKEKTAEEVYNLIYSLEFVDVKYSMKFQDLNINQLSPGQRGLLLLIFYLLVDTDRKPLILDQPEENLDNETIVKLLVPAIAKAKENRQIMIVTHNPNLAVYCDAEQIIYSSFDRVDQRIKYVSGSIENPEINAHVINVLEGTKPAFDNRGGKYM